MRIIIDGNDGVGKTTLSNELKDVFQIPSYIHLSYNDPTNYEFYFNMLLKDNVIFDRSFMDEKIYSKVLNRPTNLFDNEINKLHLLLKKLNYIVIICYSDKKRTKENELQQIKQNEKNIDNYFKDLAHKHNYIYFNMFKDDLKTLIKQIEELNEKLY